MKKKINFLKQKLNLIFIALCLLPAFVFAQYQGSSCSNPRNITTTDTFYTNNIQVIDTNQGCLHHWVRFQALTASVYLSLETVGSYDMNITGITVMDDNCDTINIIRSVSTDTLDLIINGLTPEEYYLIDLTACKHDSESWFGLNLMNLVPQHYDCASAKSINPEYNEYHQLQMGGKYLWTSFTASDTTVTVFIDHSINGLSGLPESNIDFAYLANGSCSSVNIIASDTFASSGSAITFNNLTVNNSYWIKLEQNSEQAGSINLILINGSFAPPTIPVIANAGLTQYSSGFENHTLGGNPTAKYGTSPYTYAWSSSPTDPSLTTTNVANPVVKPTITTWYTVTVTDSQGKGARSSVRIYVNQNQGSIETLGCLIQNSNLTLKWHSNLQPTQVKWDFGDGTFSSQYLPVTNHTYTQPGYYWIRIFDVSGINCLHNEIIYIIPSLTGYNANGCICDYNGYTDNNITISTDATWTSNRKINGTVRITNNATLTINNSAVIGFSPIGKIIVEPGANLQVNTATLTGIDYGSGGVCGSSAMVMMWMGIEVWGVASNTAQNPSVQGEVVLNGATISHAHNAIIAGKTLLTVDPNNLTRFVYNSHDESANGGIVKANNTTFNQNARSILVWDFPSNHQSEIHDCIFTSELLSTGAFLFLRDPYYKYSSTGFFYDKVVTGQGATGFFHNPHFAGCWGVNTNGESFAGSRTHIFLHGVKNEFNIYDNTFKNSYCAVNSESSAAFVGYEQHPNTFTNNVWGVRIEEGNTLGGVRVEANYFYLNAATGSHRLDNQCGIKCQSGHNNYIYKNYFDGYNDSTYVSGYPLGVGENNSCYYTVRDNEFNYFNNGIKLNHNGGTASSIYNNYFDYCDINIKTGELDSAGSVVYVIENNLGVQIKCNKNRNTDQYIYDDNWQTRGEISDQGVNGSSTNDPAGNYFDESSRKHINNLNTDSRTYTYYHHNELVHYMPTSRSTQTPVDLFNTGRDVNDSTCVEIDTTGEGGDSMERSLALLDAEYTQLESDKQTLENSINPSQTLSLLQGIQSTSNLANMGNWLLAASPLADTVLMSIAASKKDLGNELFKQVMLANAPFSQKVYAHLQNKLNRLPISMRKPIEDAQNRNSKNTITGINRQLHATLVKKGNYTRRLLNNYLKNDSLDKAMDVLIKEKTTEANLLLSGAYIMQKDYEKAKNLLLGLQNSNDAVVAFKELNLLLIDLSEAGKSIWNMNEMQYAKVFEIANYCPAGLAAYQAQAILRNAYGIIIPECEYLNNSLNNSVVARIASEKEKVNYLPEQDSSTQTLLGDNLPNPATNTTLIPFLLDKNQKNAYICISDLSGKMLKRYAINAEQTSIEVDLSDFESGMYIYSLQINNKIHSSKRFNIIK